MQTQDSASGTLLQAISVSSNPLSSSQQRSDAVQFFEQIKKGDVHSLLQAAGPLASSAYPVEVQIVAYSLLNHVVKNRWPDLRSDEQAELSALAIQRIQEVAVVSSGAWSIRSKVAALLAAVVRTRSGSNLAALVSQLLQTAELGPSQAEVACLVLQFVSEDLTQFEEAGGEWKRNFLAALTSSLDEVLPAFYKLLEHHFAAAVESSRSADGTATSAHAAVVTAALRALCMFAEWCPMSRLVGHRSVEAVTFLLNTQEFRLDALEVLRQVCSRKRATEVMETYTALMASVAQALLGVGEKVVSEEWREMESEGRAEEFGKRLCSCLVALAEGHIKCIPTVQEKYWLLQQMLRFLGHPHLALASLTLPFWTSTLRDALAALQQPSKPESADTLLVPPDCCQAVMEVVGQQLPHVVLHAEEGGELPSYFDTATEFKEFANTFRAQAKMVLRMAAQLAPEQALSTASSFLSASLAMACDRARPAAQRHLHMEAAVFYVESVVPALSESTNGGALAEGIANNLMRPLLAFNDKDAIALSLLVRGLESFGKFLSLRPDLALPTVEAVYQMMEIMELPHPANQPPPPTLTLSQRTALTARMCLAKVPLQLAKSSPAAFAPQIQSLVSLVQQSTQAGRLTEGEKLQFSECILAAASVMDSSTQTQALQWVLTPVHVMWTSPQWQQHLASPATFAEHYMSYRQQADGSVVLESREERWSLYHQVILLERAVRRTPKAGPGTDGSPPPPHPFTPHLEWVAVVLARIIYCLHGLWAPAMQSALHPLSDSFRMDPVERAVRMGEDREAARKDVEADHMAGATPAGLRYWLRGMREGALMVLSLLGSHCPALWTSPPLASALPPALLSFTEHMEHRHMRVLLRHVMLPWLASCPPPLWRQWLLPLSTVLLPHMMTRLTTAWGGITSQQNQEKKENAREAGDEVVQEAVLRDVTREHLSVLQHMSSLERHVGIGGKSESRGPSERGDHSLNGGEIMEDTAPTSSRPSEDLFMMLLWQTDRTTAIAAASTAVAALCWPDTESTRRATVVCRFFVSLAEHSSDVELLSYVGGDMLRAAILSMSMVSTLAIQAEVLSLARAILLLCLPKLPATKALLLSLPNVTPEVLSQFEGTLQSRHSEKRQRDAIKALLLTAGGESMRPLLSMSSFPKATVTNVTQPRVAQGPKTVQDEAEDDWWGTHTSLQW